MGRGQKKQYIKFIKNSVLLKRHEAQKTKPTLLVYKELSVIKTGMYSPLIWGRNVYKELSVIKYLLKP